MGKHKKIKCDVCEGDGKFAAASGNGGMTSEMHTCRRCDGTGNMNMNLSKTQDDTFAWWVLAKALDVIK